MIIQLSDEQIDLIINHVKKTYPVETCGLLFGQLTKEEAIVKKVVLVRNVLNSTVNFEIDPEEFLKKLLRAEEEGMELIGFFHSHPAAPHPSSTDIKYMKLWPEKIWLIVSSLNFRIKAYQTIDEESREVRLELQNSV